MTMTHLAGIRDDIASYVAGDDAAGERLCASLDPAVRDAVYGFFRAGEPDRDDLVQDTLLALLRYLRGGGSTPENPEAFCVTIARNRCRNLHQWRKLRPPADVEAAAETLPDTGAGPLELLEAEDRRRLVREAFAQLGDLCRNLLRDFYMKEKSIEELREELGLGTVQGVYHRKNVCVKELKKLFNRSRLGGRSFGGTR